MIDIETVLLLHNKLIERYGGTKGLRDSGSLISAIERPWSSFDLKDLYPSPIDKAAALIESLIKNHPFLDGNKRIGFASMYGLLLEYELHITADEEDIYSFVIDIASGKISFDEIKDWIQSHVISAEEK